MAIALKDITKTYYTGVAAVYALAGVTLSIGAGEFAAIIGPSGSGKSTLMNIIGCIDHPTSGSYRLAGQEVAAMNDLQLAVVRNREIGFVFQSFNLLPRMSALENVMLPLVYAAADQKKRLDRARQALAAVGLNERRNHRPNELSGGQRQRVAIARALVNDPAIIIADEPTGNLDSRTSGEIMELFCRLNSDGRIVIMVTHDPDIAAYAGRIIQVRDGSIISDGAAKKVGAECSGKV
jgi:putative ABC transport system ATP-binding protein